MTIIYSITLDDYLQANRTFARHTTRRRRFQDFLLRWIYVPLGLLLLLAGFLLAYAKQYLAAWIEAVIGCFLLLGPWNRRRMLRRLYVQQQLGKEAEISIDNQGIYWQQMDKSASATYHWEAIKQGMESSVEFLFFIDEIRMIILPTRVLDPQQQDELRSLLRQHISGFRQVR